MTDGADDYRAARARLAAERRQDQRGGPQRWLTVFGIGVVVLIGLGVWLKPPVEDMEEAVGRALEAYVAARTAAGETLPAVSSRESRDWIVAVSHVAQLGDHTFSCASGYKVTFCASPDEE